MLIGNTVPNDTGEVAEPSFSDDAYDFEDNIPDEELVDDLLRKRPSEDEYKHCCVMVFGIPVIADDRLPKLKSVLGKLFSQISEKYNDFYPLDADGKTKGYCFVEYPNKDIAEQATSLLDGYKLDKSHTFSANMFDDLYKYTKPDENWQPPAPRPYVDFGDLWSWLQNPKCYDQFGVLYEQDASILGVKSSATNFIPVVGIYDFKKGQDPQLAADRAERQTWTETTFQWSPHGTFLASIHRMGVALWAGKNFDRFARFQHENVMMLDFSPKERFIVTYAPRESISGEDPDSMRVFDVQTGEMLRVFSLLCHQETTRLPRWPYFEWSYDEKYCACIAYSKQGPGLAVYETENFTLLNKKFIILEGLRSFQWSPTRSLLAYYCEERTADNAPAEIGIMEFPSEHKIRAQRIFSVSEAELFWNRNGDRLAAHTERYQKKIIKNIGNTEDVKFSNATSHIEIFDARDKDVSVLSMPLPLPYVAFGWEPAGEKFCVLVGTQHKTTPLIFILDMSKHIPQLISKFEAGDRFNTVSWAPAGGWLAVYSALSSSGSIMFIDSNIAEPTRTNLVEFPGFNKGSWDPTGRFFAASFTTGAGKLGGDTGYRIYTFQGKELFRKNLERMSQFKWRPRPPIKLPDEKIRLIRKNLKATSAKFEEEDKKERGRASQEVIEKRRKIMAEFNKIRSKNIAEYESQIDLRRQLRDGFESKKDEAEDLVEETITMPLTTEKVKIQEAAVDEE